MALTDLRALEEKCQSTASLIELVLLEYFKNSLRTIQAAILRRRLTSPIT